MTAIDHGHAADWATKPVAREAASTEAVLARFADTPSPRLRELTQALVRHLPGFAREVRLTESEMDGSDRRPRPVAMAGKVARPRLG